MEKAKFFINNTESLKEITEGVFLDIHGNVFVFDDEAYISSYEDDGPNLRVIKHPNKYTTVIINIEDAYRHLFGGDEKPSITIISKPISSETKETKKIKSEDWIKDPHARYNYRTLKDAYIAVVRDGWSMKDAAEASGVKIATVSAMCCKNVHVAFTDALDNEFDLTPHKFKRRSRRELTVRDMESLYIEFYIHHIPKQKLGDKYKVSVSTVENIINGNTEKAKRMIEELTRSGRFVEAKRKFDASKEGVNEIA